MFKYHRRTSSYRFMCFFLSAQADGHDTLWSFCLLWQESSCDGNRCKYVACVWAGVIVSTPTGSTAYAAAAGASMIHPNVPAIMVTPICPHSLSFRPIVVPAGVELMVRMRFCHSSGKTMFAKQTYGFCLFVSHVTQITLSPDARNTAWVSFDGRKRQEIQHGDRWHSFTQYHKQTNFTSPIIQWYNNSWVTVMEMSVNGVRQRSVNGNECWSLLCFIVDSWG